MNHSPTPISPEPNAPAAEPVRELNASQLRGLDLSSHVAITAAAGSGKTTVLVERFVRILEQNGFHPERIVSITFTEEAASQMKERIRAAIEKRLAARDRDAPNGPNLWRRASRFLSLAKITTIHGFCLSLLREYPLDAGLDPGFQIPGPAEQQLLLEESVAGSLREFSRNSHPALGVLLDYVSRSSLEPMLRQMVQRRNHLGRLNPEESPPEILVEAYRNETAALILRLADWDRLQETLDRLPGRLLRDSSSCARRCQRQKNLFRERDALSAQAFVAGFDETFSLRVSPSRSWKESGFYEPLKQIWDSLKKEIRKLPLQMEPVSPAEDRHFQRAVNALRELYRQVLDEFQNIKKERGLVDFDDLLEKASRLLRKSAVREAVQTRYQYFLVDEFQDTNRVQWEILEPLLGAGSNLLAVGDAKQSIYRFRDADVSIFQEVQSWIRTRGQVVEMPENYRSLPELVTFCNQVFSGLFQGGLPYEAANQTMQACRSDPRPGAVEAFFHEPDDAIAEAELTAAWVLHLVEEGRSPGEIAILLRARTRLKDYERALSERGIPFQTIGGVGFYERQEILDLLSLARFLVDPGDAVALVGVLRSPIFSFSDEELFSLSLSPGGDLWEKLQGAAGTKTPTHWGFAVRSLGVWLEVAGKEKVATLFRRVMRDSGYAAVLAQSRRGRQSLGNVAKLLETAREFERAERRGLRQFLRYVEALRGSEAAEPESVSTSPQTDHIRIYTIHGAKGLQFPVVILPELGSPLSSAPSERFLCETLRSREGAGAFLGFKIRNPDDRYRELDHPVHRMLQRLDQYRQIAEEKRLLYVACTRAEDHLVLIGKKGDPLSCVRWLRDAGAERRQIPGRLAGKLVGAESGKPSRTAVDRLEVRSLRDTPDALASVEFPTIATPPPKHWEKRVWTPTEIANWSRCARRFQLSVVEGLSEGHPLSAEPLGTPAALVGSAVHDILEKATRLEPGAEMDARVKVWMDRLEGLFPERDPEPIERRLRRHITRVSESPLTRRMAAARRIYHEKQFNTRFEDILITGVIDRLFQDADGAWVVVDFKTNQTGSDEIDEKVRDLGYDLQVQIYLWAVSRVLGNSRVEGVLFFTGLGVTKPVRFDAHVAAQCVEILHSLPRQAPPARFPKTERPSVCANCGFLQSGTCSGATPKQKGFGPVWGAGAAVESPEESKLVGSPPQAANPSTSHHVRPPQVANPSKHPQSRPGDHPTST